VERKWQRREFYLKLISAAALIASGCWAVWTYRDQQIAQAKQQEKQHADELNQRRREADLREWELRLMVYREKKEAYALMADAAAEITTAKNWQEVKERSPKFFKVYYGRLHTVPELDPEIQAEKQAFAVDLWDYLKSESAKSPEDVFYGDAIRLCKACQKCLQVRSIGTGGRTMDDPSASGGR
jgi:ABC-type nickel/cobalt efflux system permease component RcnA